ncbi:MAG: ABC transporter permease subunit [Chloroflexi bacterium]|nr:ABC transporter permease subunit [Chloroflexota bacterium]
MWATFRHELAHMRGRILGWGLGLGLLGAYFSSVFSSFEAQMAQLRQAMEYFPQELFTFFGLDIASLTPYRFLDVKFFSLMPAILGVFAVGAGTAMLARDEEKGLLDLILAHPVSRKALFFGKALAALVAMVLIVALMWAGLVVGMDRTSLQVTPTQMIGPMVSVLAAVVLWWSLGLLLSMLLPSRRMASSAVAFLIVASFFVKGMAELAPDLKGIAKLSPFTYYQGGQAAFSLNVGWIVGLVVPAAAFVLLAWWRFERRDIRVAGEGGWGMALPARMRPARRRPAEARHAV